jgi:putative drug exporter of the RND superfamily
MPYPPMSVSPQSRSWLAPLGGACCRHARVVLLAWLAALAFAAVGAHRVPQLLMSGSGDIPGSESLYVDQLLRTEFADAQPQLLVLALRSPSLDREPGAASALLRALRARWTASPSVARVVVEDDLVDRRLAPAAGTGHLALISLNAANVREAEQAIPILRAAAVPLLSVARSAHPDLQWAITGRAALTYDLNQFSAEDTARAELRALPLTLLILLLAFGSLVAAGLPVLLGVASTTLTMGVVYVAARYGIFSNLVQSVASMIGLALGIDYSLFLLHRYRQELAVLASAPGQTEPASARRTAVEAAMATAGTAIFASGLTVLAGMGGLLITPLMETRSIGFGGCVVVALSVLVALTAVPALLYLLGPRLEWPQFLSRRLRAHATGRRWSAWASAVTRHPALGASASLALLLALAWPGLQTRFGFPEGAFLPAELQFTRGMELLSDMNLKGLLSPLSVVLTDTAGGRALTTQRVSALIAFSARLHRDPRVAMVQGAVDLADNVAPDAYAQLYADVDSALLTLPALRDSFVSRDQTRILFQVIPARDCTLEDTKALARAVPGWMNIPGLRIDLGGQPVYYNDFDRAVKAVYVRSIAVVVLVTCVILLAVFRAPLVALKALILNMLSVLAGYGVVVHVFQQGHGSAWFGVSAPTQVIPLTIPLLIFCILFGLSMDYEIFQLSRARESFLRHGDSTRSVREALAETGGIITSAALIMVAVFGAFAFARVVLVQMLGLGLAVAVLVDATVIRCLLGPALMRVAGRWNWWPATRWPAPSSTRR